MLQGEHSAILSTFIKLPFVVKIFVLSIFECPFYSGFTVLHFKEMMYFCPFKIVFISANSADPEMQPYVAFYLGLLVST